MLRQLPSRGSISISISLSLNLRHSHSPVLISLPQQPLQVLLLEAVCDRTTRTNTHTQTHTQREIRRRCLSQATASFCGFACHILQAAYVATIFLLSLTMNKKKKQNKFSMFFTSLLLIAVWHVHFGLQLILSEIQFIIVCAAINPNLNLKFEIRISFCHFLWLTSSAFAFGLQQIRFISYNVLLVVACNMSEQVVPAICSGAPANAAYAQCVK